MSKTIKILSFMLSYPSYQHTQAVDELREGLRTEKLLSDKQLKALEPLLLSFENTDYIDLQEDFVHLFDRTRALSLNLFEHIHGESRDRGQAMVDLLGEYEKHGLNIDSKELPDYLPVFLEFISTLDFKEAQDYLSQVLPILTAIQTRLVTRNSHYSFVFDALISLADAKVDEKQLAELLAVELDDPDDKEAIDELWQETEVAFGPSANPNDGCPAVRENLARMENPDLLNQQTIIKEDAHG